MDRRTFVGALAAGLLSTAFPARGQQAARVYRIGVLEAIPEAQNAANLDALRRGLRELGYVRESPAHQRAAIALGARGRAHPLSGAAGGAASARDG